MEEAGIFRMCEEESRMERGLTLSRTGNAVSTLEL